MDLKLDGKVALVTGASKGIGYGIAEALVLEGASVMIAARGQAGVDEAVARLTQIGGRASGMACDVTEPVQVDALVAATIKTFGRVDILVNNAGGVDAFSSWEELTDADWRSAFEANVLSVAGLVRAVVPHMRRAGWGRIINIASESGLQPDSFMPHYNAAKAAVLNMSKSMSKAFAGDGILVNAVSPAFVMTPLVEELMHSEAARRGVDVAEAQRQFLAEARPNIVLKRAGRIGEVGAAVAFLASEAASFITGTNLRVDGGSVASL